MFISLSGTAWLKSERGPVDTGTMATLTNSLEHTQRAREHFENLIANPELLGPDFQPVRRLADDAVVGWQAIGRATRSSEFADRASLANAAISLGLAERVDWTFRCRIFDVAAQAGVSEPIHIRPAFAAYGTVPPPRLAVAFSRARTLNVVAEVHEQAYDDPARLATGLKEFAGWGWRVAVGDLSERTDASTILQKVRPTLVTVDLSRPGRSASDPVKRYVETAQRLGIDVLAVGLDNPLRRNEAEALGATLGRGNALGAPADPLA